MHCCFGTKINQTLSTVLSTIISSKIGFLVEVRTDPYRNLIEAVDPDLKLTIVGGLPLFGDEFFQFDSRFRLLF